MLDKNKIISLNVHRISFDQSIELVTQWALAQRPGYVCFANVHMTIEAYKDSGFSNQVNEADLVLPDGNPIAKAITNFYKKNQERICGMDFTPRILKVADEHNLSIFIYGASAATLRSTEEKIFSLYPNVRMAGSISPPYHHLTENEIMNDIRIINESGPHIVFVALGCPKQEKWMAEHSNKINAILLGIGAALPVLAGLEKRAPKWMQNISLEWLYRLVQQPRRLFFRYLYTNSYFIFLRSRDRIRAWLKK